MAAGAWVWVLPGAISYVSFLVLSPYLPVSLYCPKIKAKSTPQKSLAQANVDFPGHKTSGNQWSLQALAGVKKKPPNIVTVISSSSVMPFFFLWWLHKNSAFIPFLPINLFCFESRFAWEALQKGAAVKQLRDETLLVTHIVRSQRWERNHI